MESGRIIEGARWSVWLGPSALLAASWIVIAAMSMQPPAGAEVLAVAFPPWWSMQRTFVAAASADAGIVRMTAIPGLLVVRPAENDGLARLREAGAWLTIDPQAISACSRTDALEAGNDLRKR